MVESFLRVPVVGDAEVFCTVVVLRDVDLLVLIVE